MTPSEKRYVKRWKIEQPMSSGEASSSSWKRPGRGDRLPIATCGRALVAALVAWGFLGAGATAFAQDKPESSAARDDAVKTAPKWEAFGEGDGDVPLDETFFRLAQDFVSTAEVGYRRLGEVPPWPRGELKFGRFRVLPYVRTAGEWESNVVTQSVTDGGGTHGRESAFAHINTIGLLSDMTLAGGRMKVAFSADSEWADRHGSRNGEDTWQLDSQLGVTYRWPSGMWVRGGVAYERRADSVEVDTTGEARRTNRRAFYDMGFDKVFGSKVNFEVGANTIDVDPREKEFNSIDRTEIEYWAKASYPFWKKSTRLFARYRYRQEQRESDTHNDGDVNGVDVGIEGAVPLFDGGYRSIRGTVAVGYDRGIYEDDTFSTTPLGERLVRDSDSSKTNLAVRAAIQYLMSPRTTMELRYLRTQQFNARGSNYQIVDRVDYIWTQNLARQLVGRALVFFEHSDPSGVNPQRSADGTDSVPISSARSTSRWGLGVGARYAITDWMDADFSYDYTRVNGAGQPRSYSEHRALLGLTFYLQALKPAPSGGNVR